MIPAATSTGKVKVNRVIPMTATRKNVGVETQLHSFFFNLALDGGQ